MKKFCIVLVFACSVMFLGGCAPIPNQTSYYNNDVFLILQFRPDNTNIPDAKLNNLKEFVADRANGHNMIYSTVAEEGTVEVALWFDNYDSFCKFNNTDKQITMAHSFEQNMLFVERTTVFKNPWELLLEEDTEPQNITLIKNKMDTLFGNGEYSYIYALITDVRRTSTNAVLSEKNIGEYYYFFPAGEAANNTRVAEVQIFERYPNDRMWYVIGIGATAVIMLVIYLISRKRKTNKQIEN